MIREFTYTKDNGEVSERKTIVISSPRQNYLVYDVTNLSREDLFTLNEALALADECRENCLKDFELLTKIKVASLWRSFKPEGIEWKEK